MDRNASGSSVLELDYHDKPDDSAAANNSAADPSDRARALSPVAEEVPSQQQQPAADPPTRKASRAASRLGALKGKGKRGKSKSSEGSGSRR